MNKKRPRLKAFLPDVHNKLVELLSDNAWTPTPYLLEDYRLRHRKDWGRAVERFGLAGARKSSYSANTYFAKRLANMRRMGALSMEYTLLDGRRVAQWKLRPGAQERIADRTATDGTFEMISVTTRIFAHEHEEIMRLASQANVSFATELRRLLHVGLTEARKGGRNL